jgi:hypothetical protein
MSDLCFGRQFGRLVLHHHGQHPSHHHRVPQCGLNASLTEEMQALERNKAVLISEELLVQGAGVRVEELDDDKL